MCVTKYSVEVDVWAAGCILAELVLLEPLFRGGSEGEQMFKILEVLGSMGEEEVAVFKTQVPFKEAIFSKFEGFPRRNLEELFGVVEDKHNFINLLSRMLEYLPQKRITAAEALNHPFFQDLHATTAETDPPSHLT
jgi:serine/threonine protein kinase